VQQLVFGAVKELLAATATNEKGRETLMKETMGGLRELMSIDPKETAILVQGFVAPGDDDQITRLHQTVSRLLKPYPRLLFQYLHTLLGPRKPASSSSRERYAGARHTFRTFRHGTALLRNDVFGGGRRE
jgi:hypothetical protein